MRKYFVIMGGHNRVLKNINLDRNEGVDFILIDFEKNKPYIDTSKFSKSFYIKNDNVESSVYEILDQLCIFGSILEIKTVSEIWLVTVANARSKYLNDKNTLIVTTILKDKFLMRDFLSNNGLSNIDYKLASSVDDIMSFLKIHQNIIVKPRFGAGSNHIYKICHKSPLPTSLILALRDIEFICEEYIDGKEFSVETITVNGKSNIIGITEKIIDKDFIEISHVFPYMNNSNHVEAIYSYIDKVLNLLPFENSPGHYEVKLDDSKGNITVETIEGHNRPGGGWITELILLSSNYNLYEEIFSLNMNFPDNFQCQGKYAVCFFSFDKEPSASFKDFWNSVVALDKEIYNPIVLKKQLPSSSDRSGHCIIDASTDSYIKDVYYLISSLERAM